MVGRGLVDLAVLCRACQSCCLSHGLQVDDMGLQDGREESQNALLPSDWACLMMMMSLGFAIRSVDINGTARERQ